ncbi:MAG: hypothetical protein LC620_06515 [Halobacteriales archaeon]|nr:hypothetical protein [Halobacteriales archaeon]
MPFQPTLQGEQHRANVLAYVAAHPCCTLNDIAHDNRMHLSQARHHLQTLEKRQQLTVDRAMKGWCIYLPGTLPADSKVARAIAHPERWELLVWMRAHSTIHQRGIIDYTKEKWKWSRGKAQRRVKGLLQAGLIETLPKQGRTTLYRVTQLAIVLKQP